uniref:Acyltransferase n=1 Tax=Noctiluca scintillans TaxID=2966 RepID=A0A7S1B019_NOCSC|mmetsp:Transcript_7411/g.20329  ORF Transcript_7411/g.20329 Transcript_7411/m.20329 type:complete len:450 (+) Transcript_7411:38-1387(+)|eukprot:CAMPEP_0194490554 /NCGR_PEP_ID=MMETSP0253-20130528/9733_1 /TAXON_ID=2966 /ORGANISM="Noctiluca scintillans" /LENGTH=449 /DNA_ID=CAMNT_0039331197 /DNA_START=27 /DNA_END=1376 /DNA_ORIENTATION=-
MPKTSAKPDEARVQQLEKERDELQRELGQLRRQVQEQEAALAVERQLVVDILAEVKGGVSEVVSRCEATAARPRAQIQGFTDDLDDEPTNVTKVEDGDNLAELPSQLSSWPEYSVWRVPWRRRLQTVCTLFCTWTTPLLLSFCFVLWVIYVREVWAITFVVVYVGWMFMFDDETPRNGRPWWLIRAMRNLPVIWKACAGYYPLQLVKTADLDPSNNFMFCLHPHGFFSLSHAINFATNGTNFMGIFPGVKCLMLTLRSQFKIPFHREYLLNLGVLEVSREALQNTLTRGPGWSVALVPGGAQEALDAKPGTMKLTLLKRKGFVKIALRNGSSLVPVLAFGENELYAPLEGIQSSPLIRAWRWFFKKFYGLASPAVMGRGVFSKTHPDPFMLPFRKPVTTVVGAPLAVPRLPEPTGKDIDYWHTQYLESLRALWERSAPVYAPGVKLEIV